MKYVRKVMAIGLAIIFCIAIVIGTGIILSVRNVNVSFIDYSGKYEDEYKTTRENLNKLKGSGLLFIGDEDVTDKVSAADVIAVQSYEKKFPCTINVVLRERVETFAVKTEAGYRIYDERGELIRTTDEGDPEPVNALDGCPDVLLTAPTDQVKELAAMCGYFSEYFGSSRRLIASVTASSGLKVTFATVKFRSGLTFMIHEWNTSTGQKVKKAYDTYTRLSDVERIGGTITVADGKDNSGPVSNYSKS